jgi:hypothetical protein
VQNKRARVLKMLFQFHVLFIPTLDLQFLKLKYVFLFDYFEDAVLVESSLMIYGVTLLVEALCYKPEGYELYSPRNNWIFNWPTPSSCTMALRSTQPLTAPEVFVRVKRGRRRHLWADCLENLGTSTSYSATDLHGLFIGFIGLV